MVDTIHQTSIKNNVYIKFRTHKPHRTLHVELYDSSGGPSGTSANRLACATPWRWTTLACTAAKACRKRSKGKASVGGSKGYLGLWVLVVVAVVVVVVELWWFFV